MDQRMGDGDMAYKTDELKFRVSGSVNVDSSKTFTTVVVEMTQGSSVWVGLGTAKRARGDKYDESIGTTLATARALRDMAEDLEDQAALASG